MRDIMDANHYSGRVHTRNEDRLRERRKRLLIRAFKELFYRIMKAAIFILIGVIIGFLFAKKSSAGTGDDAIQPPVESPSPLQTAVDTEPEHIEVLLDPGHGGKDTGSLEADEPEKDINLRVALLVEQKLKDAGISVAMTRDTDKTVSLDDRVRMANEGDAAVFVSIHQNSYDKDSGIRGIETWFHSLKSQGGQESEVLASLIQSSVAQTPGIKSRGAVPDADLKVLRETNMAACLIECGYLTNPTDRNLIRDTDFQEQLAGYIADGIIQYLQSSS